MTPQILFPRNNVGKRCKKTHHIWNNFDLNLKSESYFEMSNLAANYKCITFVVTKAVLVLADGQLKDTN